MKYYNVYSHISRPLLIIGVGMRLISRGFNGPAKAWVGGIGWLVIVAWMVVSAAGVIAGSKANKTARPGEEK